MPLDAYVYLTQVLEQVNAITGEMFTRTALQKMNLAQEEPNAGGEKTEVVVPHAFRASLSAYQGFQVGAVLSQFPSSLEASFRLGRWARRNRRLELIL